MELLYFATSNRGKIASLEKRLERHGISVTGIELELVEPQSTSVEEVAVSKAAQAFSKLGRPVLVQDAGFVIPGLGGFPGPYAKDMLSFFGPEGFLRLAEPLQDRRCHFVHRAVYVDSFGHSHIFRDDEDAGTLARELGPEPGFAAWSELARIFIPEGFDKVLSRFTEEEVQHMRDRRSWESATDQFVRWLAANPTTQD